MDRVLIVANDPAGAGVDSSLFIKSGFRVEIKRTGRSALAIEPAFKPTLIVLDTDLPDMCGFDLCSKLVNASSIAAYVVLISSCNEETDILDGFALGADDYLIKPVSALELIARVRSFVRRRERERFIRGDLVAANFHHDRMRRMLCCGNAFVELSEFQSRLLWSFLQPPGRLMSREDILKCVGSDVRASKTRVADMHVANLRKKFRAIGANAALVSMREIGYRLDFSAKSASVNVQS